MNSWAENVMNGILLSREDVHVEFRYGRGRKIFPRGKLEFREGNAQFGEGYYFQGYFLRPSRLVDISWVRSIRGDHHKLAFALSGEVAEPLSIKPQYSIN